MKYLTLNGKQYQKGALYMFTDNDNSNTEYYGRLEEVSNNCFHTMCGNYYDQCHEIGKDVPQGVIEDLKTKDGFQIIDGDLYEFLDLDDELCRGVYSAGQACFTFGNVCYWPADVAKILNQYSKVK